MTAHQQQQLQQQQQQQQQHQIQALQQQQQMQQHQQMQGPPGIGMGRGPNNPGIQMSALAGANPFGHLPNPSERAVQEDVEREREELLNSYIYDHLLKSGFYNAARGLLGETKLRLLKPRQGEGSSPNQDGSNDGPQRRAAALKRSQSNMDHANSPNDKPNGKSPGSGSNSPHIANSDLPAVNVPLKSNGPFLREWWDVFWDIYAARHGLNASVYAHTYTDALVTLINALLTVAPSTRAGSV
jgi:LisH